MSSDWPAGGETKQRLSADRSSVVAAAWHFFQFSRIANSYSIYVDNVWDVSFSFNATFSHTNGKNLWFGTPACATQDG